MQTIGDPAAALVRMSEVAFHSISIRCYSSLHIDVCFFLIAVLDIDAVTELASIMANTNSVVSKLSASGEHSSNIVHAMSSCFVALAQP